jgi:hypothetical protein
MHEVFFADARLCPITILKFAVELYVNNEPSICELVFNRSSKSITAYRISHFYPPGLIQFLLLLEIWMISHNRLT